MAQKEIVAEPSRESLLALVYIERATERRVRANLIQKLMADLDLLAKDEIRLRRSRKRTAPVDRAVIAGQILGLRQAIQAVKEADGAQDTSWTPTVIRQRA